MRKVRLKLVNARIFVLIMFIVQLEFCWQHLLLCEVIANIYRLAICIKVQLLAQARCTYGIYNTLPLKIGLTCAGRNATAKQRQRYLHGYCFQPLKVEDLSQNRCNSGKCLHRVLERLVW